MILSSERFAAVSMETDGVPEYIQQLFRCVPTKIIVYLRPQDELAESTYKQRVHSGLRTTFADYLTALPGYFDYAAMLSRWSAVFGVRNIMVRRYSAHKLIDDFLAAVQIPATLPFVARERRENISISARTAQVLVERSIDRQSSDYVQQLALIRAQYASDPSRLLTEPIRSALRRRYISCNREVATLYLGEPELFR